MSNTTVVPCAEVSDAAELIWQGVTPANFITADSSGDLKFDKYSAYANTVRLCDGYSLGIIAGARN